MGQRGNTVFQYLSMKSDLGSMPPTLVCMQALDVGHKDIFACTEYGMGISLMGAMRQCSLLVGKSNIPKKARNI